MTNRFPEQFWIPGEKPVQATAIEGPESAKSEPLALESRETATVDPQLAEPQESLAELPWSVFLPDPYEPAFPYPLLIWLHGAGHDEDQVLDIMPSISERNVIGIGLRGDQPWKTAGPRHFGWKNTVEAVDRFGCRLYPTIRQLRRLLHVHTERVFIGGMDDGATMALQLLLRFPEWFAGAAVLNTAMPRAERPLANFRQLAGKKLMLGTNAEAGDSMRREVRQSARLLHSAGLDVSLQNSDECDVAGDWLRRLDLWILQSSPGATIIS